MTAAEELFISQSTLSKHIMALEDEIGVTLFNRTTRKMRISCEGALLLSYAKKIIQLEDEYLANKERSKREKSNTVTLASTSQIANYCIMDALIEYKQINPSFIINIITEPHSRLKRLLIQGMTDFIWIGETSEELLEPEFDRLLFYKDPLVAVFPKHHHFFKKSSIPVDSLKDEQIIVQDNSSIEQQVFCNFCKKHSVEPSLLSISGRMTIDFVHQGLGIAIMLKSVAGRASDDSVKYIDIVDSPFVYVSLLHLRDAVLSKSAYDFFCFLKEWKDNHE